MSGYTGRTHFYNQGPLHPRLIAPTPAAALSLRSQLLGAQKSRSLTAPTGTPIGEMDPTHVALRDKSLLGILMKILSRFNKDKEKKDD